MPILKGKVREEEAVAPSEVASVVQTLMTSLRRCLVAALTSIWEEVVSISVIWVEVNVVKAKKGSSSKGNSSHPHLQKKRYQNFLRTQMSYN